MEKLHPKAIWLFFFHYAYQLIVLLIPVGFLVFPLVLQVHSDKDPSFNISIGIVALAIAILVAYTAFCYLLANLTYRFWRYELTEDSLKIEKGIIWKKYIAIPYDRVQNVDIYRGPADRILGLSDLHVQTAGYSGTSLRRAKTGISSEGRLPGLAPEIAEQLRNRLIKRAKGTRHGL